MAYPMSKEQNEHFKDVKDNMNKHVQEYKDKKEKELKEGKREELEKELKNLQDYVKGCQEGRISDIQTNIQFTYEKSQALKGLLEE